MITDLSHDKGGKREEGQRKQLVFVFPSHVCEPFFSPSFPVVTHDPGSHSKFFSLPITVHAFHIYRERISSLFFPLDDSRQIALTHAIRVLSS